jgi:hypothetical protein
MEKYKLIKEYPGSMALGTILTFGKEIDVSPDVTWYPEFWEKVIEKDYEILKLYANHNIFEHIEDNKWKRITTKKENYHNLEVDSPYGGTPLKIYSIKRLSDGEVFTVGNKVRDSLTDELTGNKVQTISYFNHGSCPDRTPYFTVYFESGTTAPLSTITKLKPLFTTEDGVEIFEGDKYFVVAKNYIYESTCCSEYEYQAFELIEKEKDIKQYNWDNFWSFSTKAKAEEYILYNKPCLSLNEVKDYLFSKGAINNLKEFTKNKLKIEL